MKNRDANLSFEIPFEKENESLKCKFNGINKTKKKNK